MEHVIQFGVTIDDKKIEDTIIEQASNEIKSRIIEEVYKFTKPNWNDDSEFVKMCKKEIKSYMDKNMDKIIDKLIKEMAKNALNRKAVKSTISNIEKEEKE